MQNFKTKVRALARRSGYDIYRVGEVWRRVEPEQLKRFLQHFAVDCVFDVGANEGQYGRALRSLGFQGLILSFEPVPEAAAAVRKLAAEDHAWEVFEIALDSKVRETHFNVMQGNQFSSLNTPRSSDIGSIAAQNVVSRSMSIRTATLDEQFAALRQQFDFKRPFLKMDTQGNDVEIVKGASKVLPNFVGLQSELSLEPLYEGIPDFAQAIAFYKSQGFKPSAIVPNNEGHFPDLLEVDCIMYNAAVASVR